jgi:predicted TPR repeat methyltransferase
VLLGVTLLSLGEADLAVAEWRDVLAFDPENRSAKMYLRMVEAQRNARNSKAPPALDGPVTPGPDAREEPLG